MAGSGQLGALTVDLNANMAQFDSALDKSAAQAEAWQKQMVESATKVGGAIGAAFSIAGFVSSVKGAIDVLDKLDESAQKANIGVETLGGFQFAVQMAGGSADQATEAIAKLNRTIADAAAGDKKAIQAFEAIGVAYTDAGGAARAADEVFADVADRFKSYADGPEKGALAVALFKRGGEALLPVLNAGGDALRQNIEYFAKYSGVTEENARRAGEFNDTLDKMALISKGITTTFVGELLPGMQAVADEMLRIRESSTLMNGALFALRITLETVVVLVAEANGYFERLVRKIGGFEAAVAQLASGNVKGFFAISDMVKEDNARAEAELKKFTDKVLGITSGGVWESGEGLPSGGEKKGRAPILTRPGKETKPKDRTAEYEREARAIVAGEEAAAKDVTEAWQAWEKIQLKNAEEAAAAEALMWKQVFKDIDDEQTRAIEDGKKYLDAIEKNTDDTFRRLEAAVRGWGNAFTDTFADIAMGGKASFTDLANSIIRDLLRIQIRKSITDPLVKEGTSLLDGLFGRGSGGGAEQLSGPSDAGGGFLAGIKSLFGFADGGAFRVGGSGGTDSQLVAFRASPDETVSITRPGDAGAAPQFNIINNGPPVSASAAAPRFDGRRWIIDVVLDVARTNGNFRDSIRGMVGGPAQ